MFVDRLSVSYEEVDYHARRLAAAVKDIKPWKGIIACARAGLIPATVIAYELQIKLVETLCISSYDHTAQSQHEVQILKSLVGDGEDMLLVEDIVDTGVTGKIIREMLPKAYFVSLFAKPLGMRYIDKALIEVRQDTWVDFPWEMPSTFVPKE
jgi:xanthine phosphoribosyltransferase